MNNIQGFSNRQLIRYTSNQGYGLWNIDDLNKLQVPIKYEYILDILKQGSIKSYFIKNIGVIKFVIVNRKKIEEIKEINRENWFQFSTQMIHTRYYLPQQIFSLDEINLQEYYNVELKKNETIYLQENMNMQLEDKDYISENKLLKNQINDQEEIIKQLLDRLEILDREKNKNMLGNVLSNIFN